MTTYIVPRVVGNPPSGACVACKSTTAQTSPLIVDQEDLLLCVDYKACTSLYRMGMEPNSYQLYLRGSEVLSMAR